MAFNFKDLKNSPIYPVIVLESIFSISRRRQLASVTGSLLIVFLFIAFIVPILRSFPALGLDTLPSAWFQIKIFGLVLFGLGLFLIFYALNAYFSAFYYFTYIIGNEYKNEDLYTFTVGRILYAAHGGNLLKAFVSSSVGQMFVLRAGLDKERLMTLVSADKTEYPISFRYGTRLILRDLVKIFVENNQGFAKMFFDVGLREEEILKIVDWVVLDLEKDEFRRRWWRKENLRRLGCLGESWAFGGTYTLEKYSYILSANPDVAFSDFNQLLGRQEIEQLESTLARSRGANVLLIGETGRLKMDIIQGLINKLRNDQNSSVLAGRPNLRFILFNTGVFLASFRERSDFEVELMRILHEVQRAGDVVLVFDDLASFILGAEGLGSNAVGLMDDFLVSPNYQSICLVDPDRFHQVVESRSALMSLLEKIIVIEPTDIETLNFFVQAVEPLEVAYGVRFTYRAIRETIRLAGFYFSEGTIIDKTFDLIEEIIPRVIALGNNVVHREDVVAYVKSKTKVPIGEIDESEKEKLNNLEKVLGERVVGQKQAIDMISNAMRRARAGTRNMNRPIGSFLFLGPTGVGKTETAKALAATFFGDEKYLMRLDMTEYQEDDSLTKLIGSFNSGKVGVLTSMIRGNKYGVVLLDEFEKTNQDVLNLFLQILDEGVFSDMAGKKVDARNIIFIATSNVSANQIWDLVQAGQDLEAHRDEIIDGIVDSGVLKPELLNRFDGVVIYHPLETVELKQIAGLMLKKLAKRLADQGIGLNINDFLIGKVVELGSNKLFGARPMNRYIQDNVEQLVANKIIEGSVHSGTTVEFAPDVTGNLSLQSVSV